MARCIKILVDRVKDLEIYRYAEKTGKPVVVLFGHAGIDEGINSAVHKVLNPPEDLKEDEYLKSFLERIIMAIEGKLEGYSELPRIGISTKQTYVGDFARESQIYYHFPEEGKIVEIFARMRKEDPYLDLAINYCKKYCKEAKPETFLVKKEPKTKTAAAEAAGVKASHIESYHNGHIEAARRKLSEPPRG